MARRIVHVGLAVTAVATMVAAACSAGKNEGDSSSASTTAATTSAGGDGGATTAAGGDGGGVGGAGGQGGDLSGVGVGSGGGGMGGAGGTMGCAQFSVEAEAEPAAMLITVDRSTSMAGTKWNAARFAVITAIDKDVFDTMSLGLNLYPHAPVTGPDCLCDVYTGLGLPCPDVGCGTAGAPQVTLALAGPDKSTMAPSHRYNIASVLNSAGTTTSSFDASPLYEALEEGYAALAAFGGVDERIHLVVTDGGGSCTSLSNPTRPGYSDGICDDWEYPDSVNALITANQTDPTTPIRTFIVGVPGSDTNGENVGAGCPFSTPCYATPPYSMKLALSSYAASGSPDTIDPTCNGQTFIYPGTDPTIPCHIDMTGGQFDANALADVIADIRGTALGCVYPVPDPPPGETIDLTKVNVEVTLDGVGPTTIPSRANPADDCAASPCWDYDIQGNIEILGKGCEDLSAASTAKVDIVVGCETIIN